MKWYNKYLQVYGKPFTDEFYPICEHIRERIDHLQSTRPIVTVSIIAYNEEKHLLACLWTLSDMVCKYHICIDSDSLYPKNYVEFYTKTY